MRSLQTLLVLVITCCSLSSINAQLSFSHSVGAAYYIASNVGSPGILYSPRVNLVEINDEMTVSLGTHLGLGLVANSREGASSFTLDVPVVAELNFGHGAHRDTRSSFGGFVGLGYGISQIGDTGAFGADSNDASGFIVNGGIRGLIAEKPVGLRVSYLLNSKENFNDNNDVFSLGIFYSFGY